jgi:chemotaxis protein CheZ
MFTEDQIINHLTDSVTKKVSIIIKESLSDIVQQEISKALTRALIEGDFYRSLNSDIIGGMENIYSEIKSVKQSLSTKNPEESINLLSEANTVLDDIILSTEKATLNILNYLDAMQEKISLLKDSSNGHGKALLEDLENIIMNIMTELSFQDLTGQQIKRVIQSSKKVEEIVYEIFVTSEILMKSKEKAPEKDLHQLKEETKELVREAKNKKIIADQNDIDDLLQQYGL